MKIINTISKKSGQFVSWFFLISVLITGYEVAMRYLFNAPTLWVFELSVALSAAAIITSGSLVLQQRDHIAITVVHEFLSPSWRKRLDVFVSLFGFAVCAAIIWAGYSFGLTALDNWETTGSGWNAPIPALLKPLISISAVLMTLQAMCNVIHDIRLVQTEEEEA